MTRPLYQQVADDFIGRIVSGVWAPGQIIENETDLARSLGISLGTVRKAFEILSEYDLLDRQQGKGTIIADLARSVNRFSNVRDTDGNRVSGDLTVANVEIIMPNDTQAGLLGVNVRTPLLKFERRRTLNGRVFMVEDVLLRIDGSSRTGEASPVDALTLDALALSRWLPFDLATSKREKVLPGACSDSDAGVFGIPAGHPILILERLISSHRGRALEYRRGRFHPADELHYASS